MTMDELLDGLSAIDESNQAGARLKARFMDWLMNGGDLRNYLGISGFNRQRLAKLEQARHLREAAKYVPGETPWTKAHELAKQVRTFQRNAWPHLKDQLEVHGGSKLRQHLFAARRWGGLPESAKQIHDILTGKVYGNTLHE